MRDFIQSHGFDLKRLPKNVEPLPILPQNQILNDPIFTRRWRHVPQIFIQEVDGSDAAISNEGFNYFMECRQIRKLKFNHCDYFTNDAIKLLSFGRAVKTLEDLVSLSTFETPQFRRTYLTGY